MPNLPKSLNLSNATTEVVPDILKTQANPWDSTIKKIWNNHISQGDQQDYY